MVRLSLGTAIKRSQSMSLKEILHDGVMDLFSGTQPTSANNVPDSTLLARITYGGGSFVAGVTNTRQTGKVVIGTAVEGTTFILTIADVAYTITAVAGDTVATIAAKLAALIHFSCPEADAMSDATDTLYYSARFGGQGFTIVESGTGTLTLTEWTANSRTVSNGIQFGAAVDNVLYKESGAWSGIVLVGGIVGWCRVRGNASDDDSESETICRVDMSCSTSPSADAVISYGNLVKDTVITVNSFRITEPLSK